MAKHDFFLHINIFYNRNENFNLLIKGIKPFIELMYKKSYIEDLGFNISPWRGDNIKISLILKNDLLIDTIIKEIDTYFHEFLENNQSVDTTNSIEYKEFFMNFPNNSIIRYKLQECSSIIKNIPDFPLFILKTIEENKVGFEEDLLGFVIQLNIISIAACGIDIIQIRKFMNDYLKVNHISDSNIGLKNIILFLNTNEEYLTDYFSIFWNSHVDIYDEKWIGEWFEYFKNNKAICYNQHSILYIISYINLVFGIDNSIMMYMINFIISRISIRDEVFNTR